MYYIKEEIIFTLKNAVSTVMKDDENLTDGECLDILLDSVNEVLEKLNNENSTAQLENKTEIK